MSFKKKVKNDGRASQLEMMAAERIAALKKQRLKGFEISAILKLGEPVISRIYNLRGGISEAALKQVMSAKMPKSRKE